MISERDANEKTTNLNRSFTVNTIHLSKIYISKQVIWDY
jgi:hypothetical protein